MLYCTNNSFPSHVLPSLSPSLITAFPNEFCHTWTHLAVWAGDQQPTGHRCLHVGWRQWWILNNWYICHSSWYRLLLSPSRPEAVDPEPTPLFSPRWQFLLLLARQCQEAGRNSQLWVSSMFVVHVVVKNIDWNDWESVWRAILDDVSAADNYSHL